MENSTHVSRAGGVTICLREEGGKWTAWSVIGIPTRHDTAEKAIDACLAEAKPFVGMKTHERMTSEFAALLTLLEDQ